MSKRWGSGLDHAVTDRVADQSRRFADFKLSHDPHPVRLRGLDADAQDDANLLHGLSFRDELQDFALARAQWIGPQLVVGKVRPDGFLGDARADVESSPGHLAD